MTVDIESRISASHSSFQHNKHDDEDLDEVLTTVPQMNLPTTAHF